MSIRREIEVTRKGLPNPIDVTYGTNILPIELEIIDFELPAGTTATAYVVGTKGELRKQKCSVDDNVVSFTPEIGFFEVGKNKLQVEILSGTEQLSTFEITVNCEKLVKNSGVEAEDTFNRIQTSGVITVSDSVGSAQIITGLNNIETIIVCEKAALSSQRTYIWIKSEVVSGCMTYGSYLYYFRKGNKVDTDGGLATINKYSADFPIAAGDYKWVAYGY